MPFVAGASTDSSARIIAQVLEARWGVPVKVVNKPGGNTVPAVTEVMAAKPDGTTFLMDNIASSAMLDTVVKNLPYKRVRPHLRRGDRLHADDVHRPSRLALQDPEGRRAMPLKKRYRRPSPGPRSAASAAQDMAFRQFFVAAGVDITKARAIALKGGSEAVTHDGWRPCARWARAPGARSPLPSAPTSCACWPCAATRALAGPADTPTTKEAGMPDVEALFWIGISGPPKLPADIVATWNAALKEVLADKAVHEKMLNGGVLASYEDAKDMLARVERDQKKTKELYAQ